MIVTYKAVPGACAYSSARVRTMTSGLGKWVPPSSLVRREGADAFTAGGISSDTGEPEEGLLAKVGKGPKLKAGVVTKDLSSNLEEEP